MHAIKMTVTAGLLSMCGTSASAQFLNQHALVPSTARNLSPTLDDYDGDGVQDFFGASADSNFVDVLSGKNGAVLRHFTGLTGGANYHTRAESLPDADGDGRRDFIIVGRSTAYGIKSSGGSGPIGAVPRLFTVGVQLNTMVAVGEGITMLADGDNKRAMFIDSATGAVRARIANDSGALGASAVSIGDITGDGVADFISSGGNQPHGSAPIGSEWVLSGAIQTAGSTYQQLPTLTSTQRLAELRGIELIGSGSATGFANTSVNLGDPFPGNGKSESLIVSGSPSGSSGNGAIAAHLLTAGAGGTVASTTLATYNNQNFQTALGSAVADVGDINGDGIHDVAVMEAGFLVQNQKSGRILLINGAGLLDGFQFNSDVLQTILGDPAGFFDGAMFAMGDYDQDGHLDLGVQTLFNGKDGLHGNYLQVFSVVPAPGGMVAAVSLGVLGSLRGRRQASKR